MKIIQFIYALNSGGAERIVIDLSNELAEQGHEVIICALRDDQDGNNGFYKSEISEKVTYLNLCIPKGFRIKIFFTIYNIIKKIDPMIVHCHLNLVNYIFPVTIFLNRIKYFHTIHTYAPNEIKNILEYWIRRFFYSSKKMRAITISKQTSDSFIKFYKTKNYHEIFNGRKELKASAEISTVTNYFNNLRKDSQIIFIHVARCLEVKNQKMLINVFNRIISEGHSVSLILIGYDFDSELGKELQDIAEKNIYFLGEKTNISDYYLNADAFCLSSKNEGMPITLIEALSCGCTPICTPVGGIIDTIENNKTGFLSNSISEIDYYQAIIIYLKNKENIIKENLINYYNSHFSIKECAKKHLDMYYKD